jgi:hypothetical protein
MALMGKSMTKDKAALYLHCKKCTKAKMRPDLEAFLDEEGKLWIWCRNHDEEVFHTHVPVMDMKTLVCGHCHPNG